MWTGAVITATASSVCCILPVAAIVLGVGGFAASAYLEPWRPYLLALTFAFLAFSFYWTYRKSRKQTCEPGIRCACRSSGRRRRVILGLIAALVMALAAFPHYSGSVARAFNKERKLAPNVGASSKAHVTFDVEGLDCGGCAVMLENNLSQTPGIYRAEVSFERKQAALDYDPRAINLSQAAERITHFGFRIVPSGQPTP
jgi:copper chaperone CopZ